MRKTLSYTSIGIASIAVALIFVTAKNYIQLGIGIVLYPILIYFAWKVLPRKDWKSHEITVRLPEKTIETEILEPETAKPLLDVSDVDKRAFLKLIGAAGLSFFLFSLFRGRADGLFGGKPGVQGPIALEDGEGNKIEPAVKQPTDGYQISEIDDDEIAYYGFTNKNGGWLIMTEDTESSSFRYAKGEGDFPGNWSKRQKLTYDYFYNVF